ncbi:VapC ribonuclease (plasmid) [Maritalea myrionectae]|uniref:VapC ribonuclease n=1 Tax=Maritalea myrionectae TaxID=454601 RepID=A0A2R4MJ71_9HYPH|nr:type II toxin-antitoxin system VapC family toxin [Maritalea myrionectae]AVX05976.1 VapC ribonuclease [Maritalea myrionectae]
MFIDASALVAIVLEEDEMATLLERIDNYNGKFYVSPLVRFEAAAAIARYHAPEGKKPSKELFLKAAKIVDDFIHNLGAIEIPISNDIGKLALETAAKYGKMVGHKADLNFGDCYAYACAKGNRQKLLYIGNDFKHTDIG